MNYFHFKVTITMFKGHYHLFKRSKRTSISNYLGSAYSPFFNQLNSKFELVKFYLDINKTNMITFTDIKISL